MLTIITSLSLSSGRFIQPLTIVPASSGLEVAQLRKLPRIAFARALARVSCAYQFARVTRNMLKVSLGVAKAGKIEKTGPPCFAHVLLVYYVCAPTCAL